MRKILVLSSLLFLVACATPETLAQSVFLAESDYVAALKVELAYSNLPRCGKPDSPVICSDVDIMKKMQKMDNVAWEAIQQAQKAVRTPGFGDSKITTLVASAKALVGSFVNITQTLKVN